MRALAGDTFCTMPRNQPTPQVAQDDVERVARRDFSAEDYATVMAILNEYGTEKWHYERCRVQRAALKNANRSVQRLRAGVDYRDALAAAEYPAYCKTVWSQVGGQDLSAEEKDRMLKAIGGNTKSG